MTTVDYKIAGMSCQHCVMAVKKELDKLDIDKAEVEIGKAHIEFDEEKVNREALKKAVDEAGYQVTAEL